ncbi:MAG: hypothetical protein ACREOK_04570 [Gemmatimonadaceae bacterium]
MSDVNDRPRARASAFFIAMCLSLAAASVASAQADTAARVDTVGPRPELQPPLSPRRAFLYSLLLPGYSQSVLGRHRAGALQVAFEAASIVMIRQSAADVREARRNLSDSIVVSFVDDQGQPTIRKVATPFSSSLVQSRRSHLEDWIAVLVANHLFSAADAYVAALLWDLPVEVQARAARDETRLGFRFRW